VSERDPSPPEDTGAGEAPEQSIEQLKRELDEALADRDKALAARDALIQQVLPLSRGPLEADPRSRSRVARAIGGIIGIVLVGAIGALLLQNWKALQSLRSEQPEPVVLKPKPPKTPKPTAPVEPRPLPPPSGAAVQRWEVLPIPELSLLGRAALSSDGRTLAIAEAAPTGRVARLDLVSGRMTTFSAVRALHPVRDLAFTADGSLLCGAADGSVVLLDGAGKPRATLRSAGKPVWTVAASGKLLAAAGEGTAVELFPVGGGAPKRLSGHKGWVRALAFSPRGDLLASGGHDAQIRLWDLQSGRHRSLAAHRVWVSALAFSADGSRLASADWDGHIVLWDVTSGKQLRTLRGAHSREVTSLAFDRGGQRLASGSLDRLVVVWDLATGKPYQILEGNRFALTWVGFGPGHLTSVGNDGTVRRWPLPVQQPPVVHALPPAGAGEVTLRVLTTGERLRLRLLDSRKQVLPGAAARLGTILRCGADDRAAPPDEGLVKLIERIAEHFGRDREILIISGYRSPEYNHLRTVQSPRGVAKESQHTAGTAADLRVAGVSITKLRDVVKKWRVGGVGFYPDSNFVHVDVGPVRTWNGN
jgi:uncharacterized protein YcbK (DUF882 family)